MASKLNGCTYLLFILTSILIVIDETRGLSLTITQFGQRLNITGPMMTVIGQKQCVRECLQRGHCQSVNYWRENLLCQLNPTTVTAGVGLLQDPGCIYMEKSSQPQELAGDFCQFSTCPSKCTQLSSGANVCSNDISDGIPSPVTYPPTACPVDFLWRPAAALCYKPSDVAMVWQDAEVYCTSIGARLVILDTQEKIDTVSADYAAGYFLTYQYYIGASVVSNWGSVEWQWTGGYPIDPMLLTTYSLTTTAGNCMLWNNISHLSQIDCIFSYHALCELPGVMGPVVTTISTASTTQPSTSASTIQPSTSASTTQPSTSSSTTQPSTSSSTTQPSTSASTTQPSTSASTTQPSTSASTIQPSTSASTIQPSTSASTTQPSTSASTTQPSTSASTTQSSTTSTAQLSTTSIPGPVNCPAPFVWRQNANLCYYANENNFDWQTAKTNCESMGYGARLAILDTSEKLNSIMNDYGMGDLMYYQYFIGAIFNNQGGVWKWIDGMMVDPTFKMNYNIIDMAGDCFLWDDIDVVRQYACSLSRPSLCEVPQGPVNCPPPFVWRQTANLCYYANENNFDWQTAKTNCESMGYGARLAILDTSEKLNSIMSDYGMGDLMYYQYFIGAIFDNLGGVWKWTDGMMVDPTFKMNYNIIDTAGDCFMWDDIDVVRQYACSLSRPSLCEAHGGCDRSAEDVYSSMAPDPAFAFVEGTPPPVTTCPTNFVWNSAAGLCYFVHENPMLWQDAKTHCQSIGARLAILDTATKIDGVVSDYTSGMLMNYQYFIGASFDNIAMAWKWINGSLVDPGFLAAYLVSGGPGDCLMWDDVVFLRNYPCTASRAWICDIPVVPTS